MLSEPQGRNAVLPPTSRGLSRVEAAKYVGVSPTKFDELVRDNRMPAAKRVDGRKVWDRHQLDSSFEALPADGDLDLNPWDELPASA